MSEWFAELLASLAQSPVLQGLVAALSTFILEDPTTIGCGLLVAANKMAFATAFIGVAVGIAVGDVGLYGLGRLAGPRIRGRGPFTDQRMDRVEGWFRRNLVSAVILSRFVPGMRLPTYVGAGVVRVSFWKFTAVVVGASLMWTMLLLWITVQLGEAILPLLGRYRWPVAAAAVVLLVLLQRRVAGQVGSDADAGAGAKPVMSHFERWPAWLFYIPVLFYWLWLALRHRGLLLPTVANPSIHAGGFIGESKSEILDLVPPESQSWLARYTTLKRSDSAAGEELARAHEALRAADLTYPLVAKPDVGQRGDGVQPVRTDEELENYLRSFPPGAVLMLQEMVPSDPSPPGAVVEAGVMYWRQPGEKRGEVFSITLKEAPEVEGDGVRTVGELIEADPRAKFFSSVYLARLGQELERVPDQLERVPLVFAGNHCQGAIFKDGRNHISGELVETFDRLALAIPGFYFGRFDVRFEDLEDLARGRGFKIIEINGASAEATHIWDASTRLVDAYRDLFTQFRTLFSIAADNRRRGHRPMGLVAFLGEVRAYRRLARSYPMTK